MFFRSPELAHINISDRPAAIEMAKAERQQTLLSLGRLDVFRPAAVGRVTTLGAAPLRKS